MSSLHNPSSRWFLDLIEEWSVSWRVGFTAFIGGVVSMALFHAASSIFIPIWQEEFGWTRGQIFFAANSSIIVAIMAPAVGKIIDKIGVRPLIITGVFFSCIAYVLMALMVGNIWVYYISHFILSIGGMMMGGITYSNALSQVFVKSRGISLAAVRSGVALGSGIGPVMMFYAINAADWRTALVMLSVLVACAGLPTAWFWMRLPRLASDRGSARAVTRPTPSRVISEPKFFWLAAGTAMNYAPVIVLLSQLHPMLLTKDLNDAVAAGFVGGVGIAALVGGWIAGFLIDRIWAPSISAIFSIGAALGCAILLLESPPAGLVFLAIVLIGFAYGAEHDMAPFLVAKYMGLKNFSSAYGLMYLFFTMASSLLVWMSGMMFDYSGNYIFPTITALTCFIVAAICHLALGPYPSAPKSDEDTLSDNFNGNQEFVSPIK